MKELVPDITSSNPREFLACLGDDALLPTSVTVFGTIYIKRTSTSLKTFSLKVEELFTPSAHDANVLCNMNDKIDTIDKHNENHNNDKVLG